MSNSASSMLGCSNHRGSSKAWPIREAAILVAHYRSHSNLGAPSMRLGKKPSLRQPPYGRRRNMPNDIRAFPWPNWSVKRAQTWAMPSAFSWPMSVPCAPSVLRRRLPWALVVSNALTLGRSGNLASRNNAVCPSSMCPAGTGRGRLKAKQSKRPRSHRWS